eukprot:gb/GECH01013313.1/.p1 GENE.gb/GECH01013313.1/~~gb/GECH01013313.1/.p1  ORF type:complete len:203 (+),score=40.27 gb/GECH01013313.1/:1-609(+)
MGFKYTENQLAEFEEQVKNPNSYNLETNINLLKLYQVFPHKVDVTLVKSILVRAIMNLPETDFMLCSCLVSKSIRQKPEISSLFHLAQLIENADYEKIWQDDSTKSLLESESKLANAIRSYIACVMEWTCRSISKSQVLSLLNLNDSSFSSFAQERLWTIDDAGATVTFPENDFNHPETKIHKFHVTHDSVAKTLATAVRNQ